LYDYQIFSATKTGGVSRCFYEIMKELKSSESVKLPIVFSKNFYLKDRIINPHYYSYCINFERGSSIIEKPVNLINKLCTIKFLKKNEYDVFHPTWYDPYFLDYCLKPFVTTIHDMIPEKFNMSPKITPDKQISINQATKIIAVSNHTKKDILEFYDIDPDKIEVVYHGYSYSQSEAGTNQWGDYVLYIGPRRNPYKNFSTFIQAMAILLNENRKLLLYCAGPNPILRTEEIALLKKLNIEAQVKTLHPDDKTLFALYHHAKVFVYPSLYEGFGIPILEAFSSGVPCCISEASCFPEIAQNAAAYFDPYDIESIYTAVKSIISDTRRQRRLVDAGYERLKHFSWQKTAQKMKNIYAAAIKK
jgi:glycosyltransferase involved in cell wall biosynthesis